MSTYGKYFPPKEANERKKIQRRHTTGQGLGKADTAIELTLSNNDGDNEPSTDQLKVEEKIPQTVVKKSLKRFRNALLPQVGETHRTFRLLWIVIYLGLTGVFLYSFKQLVEKYLDYPTTSKLSLENDAGNFIFPSVTVCNENPARKSMTGRYRKFGDLILLDKYVENKLERSLGLAGSRVGLLSTGCPPDFFRCESSGECIPIEWVCNGIQHCTDGSDENITDSMCTSLRSGIYTESHLCFFPYLRCNGADKIDFLKGKICAQVCDGIPECARGVDEDPSRCQYNFEVVEKIASSDEQFLVSPNYPNGNPDFDEIFAWHITVDDGYLLKLRVYDFKVDSGCRAFLNIFRGSFTAEQIKDWIYRYWLGEFTSSPDRYLCRGDEHFVDDSVYHNITIFFSGSWDFPARGFNISFYQEPIQLDPKKLSERKTFVVTAEERDTKVPFPNFDPDWADTSSVPRQDRNERKHDMIIANPSQNYFKIYEKSKRDDLSDFRHAVFFEKDSLDLFGHQLDDFIVQCSFGGQNCDRRLFMEYEDPKYGKCFIFNATRGNTASKIGNENGLKLTLFVDAEEYIGLLAQSTGARVAIHAPDIQPFMKTESMAVSTGEVSFLAIKKQETHRLGGVYSKCTDKWPEGLNLVKNITDTTYTTGRCMKYCMQNHLLRKCHCIDSYDYWFTTDENLQKKRYDNNTFKHCSHLNRRDRECRNSVYKKYATNAMKCRCLVPCNSTEYTYKASRSQWPSSGYSSYFVSQLIDSKVPRIKAYLGKLRMKEMLTKEQIHSSIRENFARVEIFYESTRYHVIQEEASFDIWVLLSDFGGSISLWLGWSIFALFEFLIFLLHCVEALYIKYYNE